MTVRKRDAITYTFRKFISLIIGRPSNFSYVEVNLAASGYPYGGRSIKWLQANHIDTVISLTEEPIKGAQRFEHYRNLPLKNDMPATTEQLLAIAKEIEDNLVNGRRVLVHCAAGKGRTGMALAAHMVYSRRMSASSAINEVIRLRPGSISRRAQKESIIRFANSLKT
ncbi:MAG: dual specificity protein phosphatase family protein [Nitrososphaerota archaeon]|nr:dual specificity protein phosphatase family protein [Nitrososphaerota archaeon]MDG7051847.1 dual specificity protein phosphatase family protein [Nitrososphaerota archaeon]